MESKPDKFDVLTADVETIQGLLSCGNITSENLVDLYLAQISKHDGFLHAMIETASREILLRQAHDLDTERRAGNIRGPPHGIPIIIKVCIIPYLLLLELTSIRITSQHTQPLDWELQLVVLL